MCVSFTEASGRGEDRGLIGMWTKIGEIEVLDVSGRSLCLCGAKRFYELEIVLEKEIWTEARAE
jgi:hypothetical protein